MIECGICFAEYREDELELHREMCVVLLMFRCTICNVDFVSKEGLWNHLDLQHEIVDGNKELHYQEVKAKQKLHQCVLCNDQRAYSERLYWNHIHDVHDGFFLRCSDCGENFQSEQHKNDHAFGHCKVKNQTVASKIDVLEEGQVPIKVENKTSDCDESVLKAKKQDSSLNSSARADMKQPPTEDLIKGRKWGSRKRSAKMDVVNDTDISKIEKNTVDKSVRRRANSSPTESLDTKCLHCDKEYATARLLREHNRTCHKPIECSVCGITNYGVDRARNHKITKHMDPSFECAKCLKKFYFKKHYTRHSYTCDPENSILSLEKSQPPVDNLVNEGKAGRSLLGHKTPSLQHTDGGNSLRDTSDPEMKMENPSSEEASCSECSQCGIKESNAVSLVCHILTHHEPVACDICGITLASLFQAQNHQRTVHRESKNKCPHCSIQTWGGIQFQIHVLKCKSLRFLCEFCGKMFADKCAVEEHKNKCRGKTVRDGRTNGSKEFQQNLLPECSLSETKCYYCNEDFSSPGYLNHHLKTHHELTKCDICGITVLGLSSRKNHKVLCHTKPKFECSHCGKKFYHQGIYSKHWSSCDRKKYSCEICGHRSKHLNIIKRHKRLEHSEIVKLEETTISSPDDPGQPTVNPSTKVDGAAIEENANDHEGVCSSRPSSTQEGKWNNNEEIQSLEDCRPSENSLASMNDDNDTDSHMDVKESRMPSVATSKDSCEKRVGLKKDLQPLVETASVQQFRCSICDKTFPEFSHIRQHMLTIHVDGMFECHLCSKKIRTVKELEEHSIVCADRKFSCEFCSQKFKYKWGAKKHKNRFHRGSEPLTIVEGTAGTEEQKSNSVEKTDSEKSSEEIPASQHQGENSSSGSSNAKCPYCVKRFSSKAILARHIGKSHNPVACDICGLTFNAVGKARKHERTCRQHAIEDDDSRSSSGKIAKLQGENSSSGSQIRSVKNVQTNSLNMPRAAELRMEIKVEDTMLQEQEDQGISCSSTAISADQLKIGKQPCGSKSKVVVAEDTVLPNGIKIKEECLDEEEENLIGTKGTTESSAYHGVPYNRNEFLVRHDAGDQADQFYMTKIPTELFFKNSDCEKPFGNPHALQNPIDVYSMATEKKPRHMKHSSDDSEPSKSKKIKMNEDKLNS